jgi:hypothetical protein
MGLFATSDAHDDVLGPLTRRRGWWRGTVDVGGHRAVPLALPGPRRGPDPEAVTLARDATGQLHAARPSILAALREHHETATDGAPWPGEPPPTYLSVPTIDGRLVLEVGYRVPWDDDHVLGARVVDGGLLELNGSVLEP